MPPRSLQIIAFSLPSRKFAKMVKRLDQRMREELRRVIDELCRGELPPGRNLEQLRFGNRLYSVRLNRNFRFVFELMEDGTGRAIAVGAHDSAYEIAKRARSIKG